MLDKLNYWAERIYPHFKRLAWYFTLYSILLFIILIALYAEPRFEYA